MHNRSVPPPALAVMVGISLALGASGCAGQDTANGAAGGDSASRSPISDSPAEGSPAKGSSKDEASATVGGARDAGEQGPAEPEERIEIGETWRDPEMGDSVEVLSVIRDFHTDKGLELVDDGGEVVLVEVSVAPGDEYGGAISEGDFRISWDDGAEFRMNETRMIEDEMEAADRPAFDRVPRSQDGEETGWIAYLVDERSETYLLQYSRASAEVVGSGETVEGFEQQLEIPSS